MSLRYEVVKEKVICSRCSCEFETDLLSVINNSHRLCDPCKQVPDHELTLVPAYGRDYRNKSVLIEDWLAGKDFKIATVVSPYCGKYTSIRDLAKFPGKQVKIRYAGLTRFILVDIETGVIHDEDEALVSDHLLQSEREDVFLD